MTNEQINTIRICSIPIIEFYKWYRDGVVDNPVYYTDLYSNIDDYDDSSPKKFIVIELNGSIQLYNFDGNSWNNKFISADDIKNFKDNLDSANVPYTFIGYPNATHAFTNPQSTATGKKFNMPIEYNQAADKKSWSDMQAFFKKLFM